MKVTSSRAAGAIGIVALILVWEVIGLTMFQQSRIVPTPVTVLSHVGKDGWHFYWPNIKTTVAEAAQGWFWGNLIAIALAMLFLVAPILEGPLMQLGVASYCLPIVAIGPIVAIVFNGTTPKVILAALAVLFTTLVGMLIGLRSADATSLDVVRAYGGGSWAMLTKVRIRASLPSLFAGLRIAAPASVLGAIIGEYLGGQSGLGVAMINSEQALDIPRTWGIALAITAIGGAGYAATALAARLLTPWAPAGRR